MPVSFDAGWRRDAGKISEEDQRCAGRHFLCTEGALEARLTGIIGKVFRFFAQRNNAAVFEHQLVVDLDLTVPEAMAAIADGRNFLLTISNNFPRLLEFILQPGIPQATGLWAMDGRIYSAIKIDAPFPGLVQRAVLGTVRHPQIVVECNGEDSGNRIQY